MNGIEKSITDENIFFLFFPGVFKVIDTFVIQFYIIYVYIYIYINFFLLRRVADKKRIHSDM